VIYICGDSFCCSDKDSSIVPWHEKISNSKSLGEVCASNLLISLQLDYALASYPSFIIINFTSCTRGEIVRGEKFIPYTVKNRIGDRLTKAERIAVELHTKHIYNLNLEIYKNKCIIESALERLVKSNVPFIFDQGGFEHGQDTKYFSDYDRYKSKYCLWDYGNSHEHRPYFHITDQQTHNQIAEYYNGQT
jgi:hypothetical protein